MGQVPATTTNGATRLNFGWNFVPLPLDEAMELARASRMDGAEYAMLREQFTLLVEDKNRLRAYHTAPSGVVPESAPSWSQGGAASGRGHHHQESAWRAHRVLEGYGAGHRDAREARCSAAAPQSREGFGAGHVGASWETPEHNGSNNARVTCRRR
jgi:hypothetical protein